MGIKPKDELKYKAYRFAVTIIKFVGSLPRGGVYDTLKDQLLRSATSIGANIVEAQAASSRRDFTQFYAIALKSANETKYWLALLRDGTNVPRETIDTLLEEAKVLGNILGASLLTLKKKR